MIKAAENDLHLESSGMKTYPHFDQLILHSSIPSGGVKSLSCHVISVPVTSRDKHRDKKHLSVERKQIRQVPNRTLNALKEYLAWKLGHPPCLGETQKSSKHFGSWKVGQDR